jgi:hypothetical protein
LQPYKIAIVQNNYFEFVTTAGTKYACYFLSYAEYFKEYKEVAENFFSFNVEILESKTKKISADERTGFTIVEIASNFWKV